MGHHDHRPLPLPAPAVAAPTPPDRRLLGAYSEWLRMERRLLHMELFPDADSRARDYLVPEGTELAGPFHLPPFPQRWQDRPQPSTRAAHVLAAVGLNPGKAPTTPDHLRGDDAALIAACDRFFAIEAAIGALEADDGEIDTMPAYPPLEAERKAILDAIENTRAFTRAGMMAKSRVVQAPAFHGLGADFERGLTLGASLADDVLCVQPPGFEIVHDPVGAFWGWRQPFDRDLRRDQPARGGACGLRPPGRWDRRGGLRARAR